MYTVHSVCSTIYLYIVYTVYSLYCTHNTPPFLSYIFYPDEMYYKEGMPFSSFSPGFFSSILYILCQLVKKISPILKDMHSPPPPFFSFFFNHIFPYIIFGHIFAPKTEKYILVYIVSGNEYWHDRYVNMEKCKTVFCLSII